ncbi:MAG: C40 family peptidase [Planctomycetes bacterium]|nr:C40 family peptidase [Planctomycetota bacterium]
MALHQRPPVSRRDTIASRSIKPAKNIPNEPPKLAFATRTRQIRQSSSCRRPRRPRSSTWHSSTWDAPLVFFRTYRKGASHVGIYIAEDKFIHAATRGGQVQVDSLDQTYYASRYLGARRVDPQS